jgi:hypothetical protein
MKIFNLEADIQEQYENASNEDRTSGAVIDSNHRIKFERNYYKDLLEQLVLSKTATDFVVFDGLFYRMYEEVRVSYKDAELDNFWHYGRITYFDFQKGYRGEVAVLIGDKLYPARKLIFGTNN